MPSRNVFNELCVKITRLRPKKNLTGECNAVFPVLYRSDAYYSTSYSPGICWLPSPEVCRMFKCRKFKDSEKYRPMLACLICIYIALIIKLKQCRLRNKFMNYF